MLSSQAARSEWSEDLPLLDLHIQKVCHLRIPRVRKDGAGSQRPRADLAAALKPAHDFPVRDRIRHKLDVLLILDIVRSDHLNPGGIFRDGLQDVIGRVLGTLEGFKDGALPPARPALAAQHRSSVQSASYGNPIVPRERWDVYSLKLALLLDSPVEHTVQRNASREAKVGFTGAVGVLEVAHGSHANAFQVVLHGFCHFRVKELPQVISFPQSRLEIVAVLQLVQLVPVHLEQSLQKTA
mmetsp:Transcript_14884/g.56423  ORF Transcript_14884/g.56423 Transcript_14884/m.56423 type:complete len:240 (-) Transcript_14884:848-1567(-)